MMPLSHGCSMMTRSTRCTQPVTMAAAGDPYQIAKYQNDRMGLPTSNIGEAGGFVGLDRQAPAPELQFIFAPADLIDHGFVMPEGYGFTLHTCIGMPKSAGSVRGQVRIYSEVGKGTTMCLYFPRFAGNVDDVDPVEAAEAIDPGHGETVLVIDDEPTVRMLMVEVLEDVGYTVIDAHDGASGLKILRSEARIDLLVTDVGLPGGMNGRQLADAARQTRPALKVLFVTGYAENAAIGNGLLDAGMQVITKPFVMAALGNKVREIIDG
jgi:CheY-like chemotaxis protein